MMLGSTTDPVNFVIDSGTPTTEFPPPPNWTVDSQIVNHVSVTIHKRPPQKTTTSGPPIITFHDIGQNSVSSFNSFFTHCRAKANHHLDNASAHIHITAPGHEQGAPECSAEVSFDVDDMVKAVLETIDRLQITRAIGIGVGLGAAILLRAAEKRPRVFGGLILISPVFHAAAAWERVTTSAEGFFSNTMGLGLSHHVKEKFLHRWLSNAAREENHSVAQVLEDALDKLNAKNVTRFVVAGTYRSGCQEIVKGIKGKVLLITGKESNLRYHTDDVFADFDPAMTSWLDLQECGSLPHEEHPDSVAEAISLFLQGFSGYA